MSVTCIKCGFVNPAASGAAGEACPQCGVIYAKAQPTGVRPVTPVMQARRASAERVSGFGASRNHSAASEADNLRVGFVDDMRRRSLYPTFRAFTQFGYIAGLVLSGLVLILAVVAFFTQGLLWGLPTLCAAIFIALLSRASKEFALMVADASDALVRVASRQEG